MVGTSEVSQLSISSFILGLPGSFSLYFLRSLETLSFWWMEQYPYPKFVQKLYKIYTNTIQNTKFVYMLHTKITKIKILYDNECTKNVH